MVAVLSPAAKAREVLDKFWDLELPVNVDHIAKALKARVEYVQGVDYSGWFDYENGQPIIRINRNEPEVRRRFTLAHELGHFQIGHEGGIPRDRPDSFSLDNKNPLEIAANRFAAELLMPERAVRFLVFDRGMKLLSELAKAANVSQVAMQFRLQNLGLVS